MTKIYDTILHSVHLCFSHRCLRPRGRWEGRPVLVSSSCLSARSRACCCTPSASAGVAAASNAWSVCWGPIGRHRHTSIHTACTHTSHYSQYTVEHLQLNLKRNTLKSLKLFVKYACLGFTSLQLIVKEREWMEASSYWTHFKLIRLKGNLIRGWWWIVVFFVHL